MKLAALVLLLAGVAAAQTATAPLPTEDRGVYIKTVQAPAPVLPNWYGAGGAWNASAPSGTARESGWAAFAKPLSSSAGVYSFTQYNAYLVGKPGKVTTGVSTGAALVVRQVGMFTLLAFATAGVATNGTVTGSTFPYGGLVDFHVGKTLWHVDAGMQVVNGSTVTAAQHIVLLGAGRTF